jgi:seryl-tRNA synthetase
MLDIKFIHENEKKIKEAIMNKGIKLNLDELLVLDEKRTDILIEIEKLNEEKNKLNAQIKSGLADKKEIIEKGKEVKEKISKLEPTYKKLKEEFDELMVKVPEITSDDTPIGFGDEENVVVGTFGKIPEFDFEIKDHIQLGKDLDILDLEKGAKIAGYRGYYVKNEGVSLMMALMMYALNKMIEKGYVPMIPPTLVKGDVLFGTGYFKGREYDPKDDNVYQIASHDEEADGESCKEKKFLIGTAEPSLLAYYSDEILKEEQLPIRVAGYSQCYRSEIGTYGKDTRGFYRVHEFMKIEQVVLMEADIEASNKMQDKMVDISKEIHEELGLPYRLVQICTGDMSAGKYRAFDFEAWMPGLKRWGETASASNFLDWQARRLNVKYVDKNGEKKYVYMLNNTVLPSPRPFIAILENFQQADGSVKIPKVLQKYMPGGMDVIRKK